MSQGLSAGEANGNTILVMRSLKLVLLRLSISSRASTPSDAGVWEGIMRGSRGAGHHAGNDQSWCAHGQRPRSCSCGVYLTKLKTHLQP